jgi:hypothetical protein
MGLGCIFVHPSPHLTHLLTDHTFDLVLLDVKQRNDSLVGGFLFGSDQLVEFVYSGLAEVELPEELFVLAVEEDLVSHFVDEVCVLFDF